MGRLEGKIAIVTGGASGIGEAIVRRFVEENATVAFCDIDVKNGEALAAELSAAGANVTFTEARVDNEVEITTFIEATAKAFGNLDILVNNAGLRHYATILETDAESWGRILGVNLLGYAFCSKAAILAMRESGGGAIVNIASIRAQFAGGGMVEYDTTKTAVVGLTRALAYDHAPDNIRVNAISPGPVFTKFHERRAAALGKSNEEFVKYFGQGGMQKRPARPVEIANCVLFLASDEASYVTGANLMADGGITAVDPDTLTSFLKKG